MHLRLSEVLLGTHWKLEEHVKNLVQTWWEQLGIQNSTLPPSQKKKMSPLAHAGSPHAVKFYAYLCSLRFLPWLIAGSWTVGHSKYVPTTRTMGYLIRVPIVRVDFYHQTLHYGGRLTIFSLFSVFKKIYIPGSGWRFTIFLWINLHNICLKSRDKEAKRKKKEKSKERWSLFKEGKQWVLFYDISNQSFNCYAIIYEKL
jgi:hypothetical protein